MGLSGVFRTMFPFISAAASMGGPLGTMAAAEIGKALKIDKVDSDKIQQTIEQAQVKDPEALLKAQEAENEFQLKMTALGFDSASKLEEIAAADRDSARARQIALKDATPAVLAYVVVVGFFGIFITLIFVKLDSTTHDILLMMAGILASKFGSVYDYFIGSSAGSKAKTDIIATQVLK